MRLADALRDSSFSDDIEDAARLVEDQRYAGRPWDPQQPVRRRPRPKPPRRHGPAD